MDISIICTNYNKGQWIKAAIEGFLNQKFNGDFEIIIFDDYSSDISKEIIVEYANKYPDLIKVYLNEENKGITKTWIDACKIAVGKYIARCDGDDYWIDSFKLQKQYDLLEKCENSLWCNSDFDIITPEGELVVESAFKNNHVVTMDSYEKMLAFKGFTMSSTWLVNRMLMLSVNDVLDLETSDDTFNLQLELFQRTNLVTLQDSTTAYRLGYESDSHPTSIDKFIQRHKNLLKTQLEFLSKYTNVNFPKLSDYLFQEIYSREVIIHQQKLLVKEFNDKYKLLNQTIESLEKQNVILDETKTKLESTILAIEKELMNVQTQLDLVINSRRWIWTSKIIEFFRRK
ncbi:TPA: glycosyltransferase family 2 protein [Streptococcus suis]